MKQMTDNGSWRHCLVVEREGVETVMKWSMACMAGVVLLGGCALVSTAKAATVVPTVEGSVRDADVYGMKDGTADSVLDGSVVQILNAPSLEDRGIIEFSLFGLSAPTISSAQLVLPVFESNGPFPYGINVYTYAGDGNLTLSDWAVGSLFTSLTFSGTAEAVALDVTSFVSRALAQDYSYAGFNFRFAVPSSIEDNGPYLAFGSFDCTPCASLSITEVPEPGVVTLMLLGASLRIGYSGRVCLRRRRRSRSD